MSDLQISSGSGVVGRASRALGELDTSLPRDVFNAVEQETLRLMEAARAAVQAMPTHGTRHTGLLQEVAEGVGLTRVISADAQHLRVTTSVPRENMASIPAGLDDGAWYHPLFGDVNHWFTQHGEYSWFAQTFQNGQGGISDEIRTVLERAAAKVAAASS